MLLSDKTFKFVEMFISHNYPCDKVIKKKQAFNITIAISIIHMSVRPCCYNTWKEIIKSDKNYKQIKTTEKLHMCCRLQMVAWANNDGTVGLIVLCLAVYMIKIWYHLCIWQILTHIETNWLSSSKECCKHSSHLALV